MTPADHTVTIEVSAPPERLYDLVSQVTDMGRWSPECRACEWLDGAAGPVVGARFVGHNQRGPIRWTTTCCVTRADRPSAFEFAVVHHVRDSARWRYRFMPQGDVTVVEESFEFVWCPLPSRAVDLVLPRNRQLHGGMDATLRALKAAAERGEGTGAPR